MFKNYLPASVEDADSDTITTIQSHHQTSKVTARGKTRPATGVTSGRSVVPDGASDSGYSSKTAATGSSSNSVPVRKELPEGLEVKPANNPSGTPKVASHSQHSENQPNRPRDRSPRLYARSKTTQFNEHQSFQERNCHGECMMRRQPVPNVAASSVPGYIPSYVTSPIYAGLPSPQATMIPASYPQMVPVIAAPQPRPRLMPGARPASYHPGMAGDQYRELLDHGPVYDRTGAPLTSAPYMNVSAPQYPLPGQTPFHAGALQYQQTATVYSSQRPAQPTFPRHPFEMLPAVGRRSSIYGTPIVSNEGSNNHPLSAHPSSTPYLISPSPFEQCGECYDSARMPPPPRPTQYIPIRRGSNRPRAVRKSIRAAEEDETSSYSSSESDVYDHTAAIRTGRSDLGRSRFGPDVTSYSTQGVDRRVVGSRGSRRYSYVADGTARTDSEKRRTAEKYQEQVSTRSTMANVGGRRPSITVPLTEEALDRATALSKPRSNVDSGSRSHGHNPHRSQSQTRSRAGSSREGSHVSKSGADGLTIRLDAREGVNIGFSGDMDGRRISIQPGEDGKHELTIGSSRRETRYEKGGSLRSGASSKKSVVASDVGAVNGKTAGSRRGSDVRKRRDTNDGG